MGLLTTAFNTFVLGAAAGIGLVAGLVAARVQRGSNEWRSLVWGAAAGAGLSLLALVLIVAGIGADIFAVAHLVYLVVTLGVPVAAALVLVRSRDAAAWFRALLAVLLLPSVAGLYASHIEPFWLRVDRVDVNVADLAIGIRVGVLSDVQTTSVGEYERGAVATLLEEDPDIVLIPGDLWQLPTGEIEGRFSEFSQLIASITAEVDHVFLVRGNTDRVWGLRQIADGTGAVVLDNEVAEVNVNGVPVRILGVSFDGDDAEFASARDRFVEGSPHDPFRLVLAHQPDEVYRFSPADPIDLLVAGHTHGGQIAVPLIGPLVTLSSVPRSVAAGGLGEVDGHAIYVSTGVGRERGYAPQVRFGVRPSIGILEVGP